MSELVRPIVSVLRQMQDGLVERAENLALSLKMEERVEGLAKSQASKAVEVAEKAETLRVFLNWAHYQAGRREADRFWKCPLEGGSILVQRLADDLAWIEKEVQRQVTEAPQRLATTRKASALLLGYFKRALIGLEQLRKHHDTTRATAPAGGKK